MTIKVNIESLMKENNITAKKLAKISGLTPVQISHIKNEKTKKIELKTIEKLLLAFNCNPNDLFILTNKKDE